MKTIKTLTELKRNVLEFEKWFVDNPTELPTFKVFYEKLGVNRAFVAKIKKKIADVSNDKSIDNMSIDKSIVKSIDKTIDKTIDYTIDKSIDITSIDKSIGQSKMDCNKVIDISLKEYKEMENILKSCFEKMQNEFWHRALNVERKYINPRLIEMYYTNFMEKKQKQDDTININIKIDKTEVSIKK